MSGNEGEEKMIRIMSKEIRGELCENYKIIILTLTKKKIYNRLCVIDNQLCIFFLYIIEYLFTKHNQLFKYFLLS